MAKDNTPVPQPEVDPIEGGSFVRNPDGTLTKTEGTAEAAPVETNEKE